MVIEVKKLGQVARVINGRAYKKTEMLRAGKYLLLRVGNFFTNKNWFYSDLELDADKYCDTGDLLYAWSASFGPRIWDGGKVIYHYHIWKIEVDQLQVSKEYLYWFLDWDKELIKKEQGAGATMIHVTKGSMENRLIPIPSLGEQKRIVEVLDEAFEQIDQAKANAEQNLKNARELFESYLQSVFDNDNDGWDEKPIQDITELVTKGSSPNWQGINYVEKGGIFFLTSKNVGAGKLLLDNKRYLESEFNEIQSKSILKKGDVLTNIVGASIGRTAIFNLDEVTNINQAVCLIRCVPNKIYNYYLMFLLNSPFFKKVLHDNEVDNARANLSLTFFKNLVVPLPCLTKQKEIVGNIQQVLIKTKSLEEIYQQKIKALDELKQSLLQKAFSGELTQSAIGDAA